MAGQDDIWAWLQSIMQNQGASQPYGPGTPTGGAGPQGLMPGGGVAGYRAATPGGPSMGYPALNPQPAADASRHAQFVELAKRLLNGGQPSQGADTLQPLQPTAPDPTQTPPRPFNWLTSTGAGMSAPPGSPSATPRPADAAPTGPLATPSGQGGIGSDARFPLKRTLGAPNLGYYQPTTGNARAATYVPFTDPNDPRIFRG